MFLSPFHQLCTDVFGSVVDSDSAGLAAPLDHPVQTADDAFGGQREVDLDAQSFAVKIIQNVQQPERTAVTQPVGHEVPLRRLKANAYRATHRPGHVWRIWHGQRIGLVTLQPLSGLDPKVQFELAIYAVNPFVV